MKKRCDAFTLLEVLLAVAVLLIASPVIWKMWNLGITSVQQRQVADHLSKVSTAVDGYIKKHRSTLQAGASPTSGATLTIGDLITDGALPTGFSQKNAWGQEYIVYIRAPRVGELVGVTLTRGGRMLDTRDKNFATTTVPAAAAMLGGKGGYVPTGDIPGQSTNSLRGSYGGWVLSLGTMIIPSPGPAHLGALSSFDQGSLAQDFLYRVAVPGQPDLNAMQTELDMRDHAIKGIKDLQFVSHSLAANSCTGAESQGRVFLDDKEGLYVCRDGKAQVFADTGNSTMFKAATVVSHGTLIDKPICPPGTNTQPEVFVAPAIASAGAKAPPLAAFQAWATSESDAQWRVQLRVLNGDGSGWVYPGANYGKVMVFTTCN